MNEHRTDPPVTALVLAAGESRRMGDRNKLLLPIDGRTVVEHVVDAVAASLADEIVVVLGHEAPIIRDILSGRDVTLVENEFYDRGMTTSIQTGVRASRADTGGFMICLSDQPLLKTAEMDRLILAFVRESILGIAPIVVPDYCGRRGNPVLFSARYRDKILRHPDPEGCRKLLETHGQHVVRIAMDTDHVLRDIDLESDYLELLAFNSVNPL